MGVVNWAHIAAIHDKLAGPEVALYSNVSCDFYLSGTSSQTVYCKYNEKIGVYPLCIGN